MICAGLPSSIGFANGRIVMLKLSGFYPAALLQNHGIQGRGLDPCRWTGSRAVIDYRSNGYPHHMGPP